MHILVDSSSSSTNVVDAETTTAVRSTFVRTRLYFLNGLDLFRRARSCLFLFFAFLYRACLLIRMQQQLVAGVCGAWQGNFQPPGKVTRSAAVVMMKHEGPGGLSLRVRL